MARAVGGLIFGMTAFSVLGCSMIEDLSTEKASMRNNRNLSLLSADSTGGVTITTDLQSALGLAIDAATGVDFRLDCTGATANFSGLVAQIPGNATNCKYIPLKFTGVTGLVAGMAIDFNVGTSSTPGNSTVGTQYVLTSVDGTRKMTARQNSVLSLDIAGKMTNSQIDFTFATSFSGGIISAGGGVGAAGATVTTAALGVIPSYIFLGAQPTYKYSGLTNEFFEISLTCGNVNGVQPAVDGTRICDGVDYSSVTKFGMAPNANSNDLDLTRAAFNTAQRPISVGTFAANKITITFAAPTPAQLAMPNMSFIVGLVNGTPYQDGFASFTWANGGMLPAPPGGGGGACLVVGCPPIMP